MPTTPTPQRDYLQAFDEMPITRLPVLDAEVYPYLPPEPQYQLLYALLRTESGVSVAEALLATLKERCQDLKVAIARYEIKYLVAP